MNAFAPASTDQTSPLLCNDICKRFDATAVLNGVSLTIPQGAVLGLIGRNGSGKTTLIRILLGLLMSDSDDATVLGEPALHMRPMENQVITPSALTAMLAALR